MGVTAIYRVADWARRVVVFSPKNIFGPSRSAHGIREVYLGGLREIDLSDHAPQGYIDSKY